MARFPPPPPAGELARVRPIWHELPTGALLWRVYFRGGAHPTTWNAFRTYGPTGARFDHHTRPPREQARAIYYAALSGRTLWALASIAFLAVYREAFETVLFYQALWVEAGPSGHLAVGAGCLAGFVGLALLAWLVLKLGLRLPVGWFFGVGSALMALLAVVLAGKGIAALQHAGKLPVGPLDLPAIPSLGVYPTWQGVLTQLALVVLIVVAVAYSRRPPRQAA